MPDMPGDTFVSQGIKYILLPGPKGNLRPYTVGPVVVLLSRLGWAGLAIGAFILIGAAVWYVCKEDGETDHGRETVQ